MIAITGIEEALLKLGHTVAKKLAQKWLAERKARGRRGRDLSDLLDSRFPSRSKRREMDRALLGVEDQVAERLAPTLTRIAYSLPENERTVAFDAVSDTLEDADLSDAALFSVDLDADALVNMIRKTVPVVRAGLSERATDLYEAALQQACIVLIHMVRELPEFDAATAVETLSRLTTSLDKLDEVLTRLPTRELDAPAGTDLDEQFRQRYLEAVVRAYDRLEVIGLTTHHYEPRTTLSVAYLSLSVTEESGRSMGDARSRHMGMDWWQDGGRGKPQQAENLRVEAALGDSKRTVIRGEAGAGKSTLLRWLAVNAARNSFTSQLADWNGCVPFVVKLREFADRSLPHGDTLVSEQASVACGPIPTEWAHRQLTAGRAMLLVDGVDELTSAQRDKVRSWLRTQLGLYPELRVVVTSRPTAITPKWLVSEGFRSVVLEPMNPADVQVFLQRWHRALLDSLPDPAMLPCHPDQVPEHERTLLSHLQSRANLRALARNPLLCAMLCALNLDRKAKLPRDRLALYSAALEMLLERRDSDRGVISATNVQITTAEKLVLLRVLAWWLNENSRNQMSRDQALDRLRDRLPGMASVHENTETLLDHLIERSGVIRQPALGKIDFIHRTFQEYLAAKEAVDRDSIDLLVRNARSDLWRETVLMACAHATAEQRGRLLGGILNSAEAAGPRTGRQLRLLAAACKETAVLVEPSEILARIDANIIDLLPPRDVRESRSLSTVGESILDYLPTTLDHLTAAQAAACFRTAVLVNGPKAFEILTKYVTDARYEVQRQAVDSWQYFDSEKYARRLLKNAPALTSPSFRVTVRSPIQVPYLKLIPNIKNCWIDLINFGPIESEIDQLNKLDHLDRLSIFCDVAPTNLATLENLRKLTYIHLHIIDDQPTNTSFIGRLPNLSHVDLDQLVTNQELEFLERLEHLTNLSLPYCQLDEFAGILIKPDQLQYLYCRVSKKDLKLIARTFTSLTNLTIGSINSIGNLRSLTSLPLASLDIVHCPDVDLDGIKYLSHLRNLYLYSLGEPVDLTPLRDLHLRVWLGVGVSTLGAETLGPTVRLLGPGAKALRAASRRK